MTLELINPDELPTPESYTQVVAATGSRLVFVAGQVAEDAQGNLVGPGDLAAQARQAFANVGRALAAAGARPEQVARITIYVVHHRPEYLPAYLGGPDRRLRRPQARRHPVGSGDAGRARLSDRGRGDRGRRLTARQNALDSASG